MTGINNFIKRINSDNKVASDLDNLLKKIREVTDNFLNKYHNFLTDRMIKEEEKIKKRTTFKREDFFKIKKKVVFNVYNEKEFSIQEVQTEKDDYNKLIDIMFFAFFLSRNVVNLKYRANDMDNYLLKLSNELPNIAIHGYKDSANTKIAKKRYECNLTFKMDNYHFTNKLRGMFFQSENDHFLYLSRVCALYCDYLLKKYDNEKLLIKTLSTFLFLIANDHHSRNLNLRNSHHYAANVVLESMKKTRIFNFDF